MNLGSPNSTSVKDVSRYLNEFLMDGKVIDYPYWVRKILVQGLIVPLRAPRSAKAYSSIWWKEGSPLIELTRQLQIALKSEMDIPVEIAMRYGDPSPTDAYNKLMQLPNPPDEVILFPLYPHYAMSSYETAADYGVQKYKEGNYPFQLKVVQPFYNDPRYINALAESIKPYIQTPFDQLLFSFHGIPERHLRKTDPTGFGAHCLSSPNCCDIDSPAHSKCYKHQDITTTRLTAKALGLNTNQYAISFQSRLGRAQWIPPYTVKRLEELPKEGVKRLVVVCPAFVSDCLETLEEMGIEGKEVFLNAGGESFTLVPCMNTHSQWVKTVAELALKE